jgi:molybdate/tungstate transport system substrate-binding protein
MHKKSLTSCAFACGFFAFAFLNPAAAQNKAAQNKDCVGPTSKELVIYRAGSLTRAFKPLEAAFTCRTGVQVKDSFMGSVDAARQITAGGHTADLYAPADYLDIDLFLKPAGYSDFDIVFAQGRMVLAYSQTGLAAKKIPSIVAPGSAPFHPPDSIPKATAKWYEILTSPEVVIGGGNPFLDPGAYRGPMIFQLAEAFYKVPNLYNNLLERVAVPAPNSATLGHGLDFQFTYEHNARATAIADSDYHYVDLPAEVNLSDPAKDSYYRENAIVVLPGLGTPRSARTISVPGARVAWGIALMKNAPNKENAVEFLRMLLGPDGTGFLKENGPDPLTPAVVSPSDFHKLPESLHGLVKAGRL